MAVKLTQKRDLRQGVTVWQARQQVSLKSDQISASETADAVVVGSGISGALMADALIGSGLKVIVVDRRKLMTGSTLASTAMLQFELDTPLMELGRKIGRERAARAWIRSCEAVRALGDRVLDLGIQCDYAHQRSSVYLPGNVLDVTGLKLEARERQRIGLRSEFIGRKDLARLTGITKPGAIFSRGNAEADPLRLTAGLWRGFQQRGGKMVSAFEASELDESRSLLRLHATDGRSITARHAVMCTGYELPKFVRPKGFRISSTWAIATRRQTGKLWPGRSLIWEAADPYIYMRTTRDGRAIVGGGDEAFSDETKRNSLIAKKSAKIAKQAQRIFPGIDFEPEFAWAGSFGESATSLPAIGPVKGYKRTYAVLGFGGNGITFSMLAAQIISRMVNGIKDPDMALFQP